MSKPPRVEWKKFRAALSLVDPGIKFERTDHRNHRNQGYILLTSASQERRVALLETIAFLFGTSPNDVAERYAPLPMQHIKIPRHRMVFPRWVWRTLPVIQREERKIFASSKAGRWNLHSFSKKT